MIAGACSTSGCADPIRYAVLAYSETMIELGRIHKHAFLVVDTVLRFE